MCLGVPGRVVEWVEDSDLLARVEVTGVRRTVNVGLVREDGLALGDWVLIHVGFALSVIDEDEAQRALRSLKALGQPFDDEVRDITTSRIQ
jgi:hydrogenase expression/formation protein HypC